MSSLPRPLSARARILGAIVAVAAVGLIVVGSVTFLAQRDFLSRLQVGRLYLSKLEVKQISPLRRLALARSQLGQLGDNLVEFSHRTA